MPDRCVLGGRVGRSWHDDGIDIGLVIDNWSCRYEAWESWNNEFGYFLNKMDWSVSCSYEQASMIEGGTTWFWITKNMSQ